MILPYALCTQSPTQRTSAEARFFRSTLSCEICSVWGKVGLKRVRKVDMHTDRHILVFVYKSKPKQQASGFGQCLVGFSAEPLEHTLWTGHWNPSPEEKNT